MITKKAKHLLKWIIRNEPKLQDSASEKIISHFKTTHYLDSLNYLIKEKLIEITPINHSHYRDTPAYFRGSDRYYLVGQISVTTLGKDYLELERAKIKSFLIKSILVPILVSIATSFLIYFGQKFFDFEKKSDSSFIHFDLRNG